MKIILFHPESNSYMYCHSEDERDTLIADDPLLIDVTDDNTHETIAHSKLGPFNEGENIEKNFDMLIEASSKEPIELAPGVTLVSGDALFNFLAAATDGPEAVVSQPAAAPVSCDWPEDFSHENGNYFCECCQCGNTFKGHKRRVTCKACAAPVSEQPAEDCGCCGGTGRMVRDPDIGTDQECFACDGTGKYEDEQPAAQTAGVPDHGVVAREVRQMLYQGYSIGVNHYGDALLLKDGYTVAIIKEALENLRPVLVDPKSQPVAEQVGEQQIQDLFRRNCVNYAGNYEVTPGQALQIAKSILVAHHQAAQAKESGNE